MRFEREGGFEQAIDAADRMLKERNKSEIEHLEKIKAEVKQLEEIVTLAVAACRDHSPLLGDMLLAKAEEIFGRAKR